MIKYDCFAIRPCANGRFKCDALTSLVCKNDECKFYKEESEYLKRLKEVNKGQKKVQE